MGTDLTVIDSFSKARTDLAVALRTTSKQRYSKSSSTEGWKEVIAAMFENEKSMLYGYRGFNGDDKVRSMKNWVLKILKENDEMGKRNENFNTTFHDQLIAFLDYEANEAKDAVTKKKEKETKAQANDSCALVMNMKPDAVVYSPTTASGDPTAATVSGSSAVPAAAAAASSAVPGSSASSSKRSKPTIGSGGQIKYARPLEAVGMCVSIYLEYLHFYMQSQPLLFYRHD
jgi:hypothetical protein